MTRLKAAAFVLSGASLIQVATPVIPPSYVRAQLVDSGPEVVARELAASRQQRMVPASGKFSIAVEKAAVKWPLRDMGESPVALLELPPFSRPYELTVTSQCKCNWTLNKRIFVPLFTVLNDQFDVTRTDDQLGATKTGGGPWSKSGYNLRRTIPFLNSDRGERFVLIHTNANHEGALVGTYDNKGVMTGVTVTVKGIPVVASLEGKLDFEVRAAKE